MTACIHTLLATALVAVAASNKDVRHLRLEITLDRSTYYEGQDIIITSTVTNDSDQVIEGIPQPLAGTLTVTYEAQAVVDGKRRPVAPYRISACLPDAGPARIGFVPRAQISASGELLFWVGELPPGDYVVRAVYHPARYASPEYASEVVVSNEVEFTIIRRTPALEEQWNALSKITSSELGRQEGGRARLRAWLNRYPESPYRRRALEILARVAHEAGDHAEERELHRALRAAPISSEARALSFCTEARCLAQSGRLEDAIVFLSNRGLPETERLRMFFLRELGQRLVREAEQRQSAP